MSFKYVIKVATNAASNPVTSSEGAAIGRACAHTWGDDHGEHDRDQGHDIPHLHKWPKWVQKQEVGPPVSTSNTPHVIIQRFLVERASCLFVMTSLEDLVKGQLRALQLFVGLFHCFRYFHFCDFDFFLALDPIESLIPLGLE